MSPEEWYKSLPFVTKWYFTLAVASTILVSLKVISPHFLHLDFSLVFERFQIWRLVTNLLFFGPFGMPFAFNIFLLVRYFSKIETEHYSATERGRSTADFVFCCLFGIVVMTVVSFFWGGLVFLGPAWVFMIVYVWSRKDPHRPIDFWGFSLQAWHLPFCLVLMSVIMGSNPILDFVGIFAGHLYHFLMDIVPRVYRKELLHTPEFLYGLFNQGGAPAAARWQRGGGYRMT